MCLRFGVGRNAIVQATRDRRLIRPEQIDTLLGVGTGCGACIRELRELSPVVLDGKCRLGRLLG